GTGQIFWLLAYVPISVGITFSPPSPFFCGGNRVGCTTKESQAARLPLHRLAQWEVVSSYSSATAPGSHGISCADPLFQARKELDRGLAACASSVKTYLINRSTNLSVSSTDLRLNLIVTGGAGFIGSNLTLALQ